MSNLLNINITATLIDNMVLGRIYDLEDIYAMVGAKESDEKHSVRGLLSSRRLGKYRIVYHGDAQYSLETDSPELSEES